MLEIYHQRWSLRSAAMCTYTGSQDICHLYRRVCSKILVVRSGYESAGKTRIFSQQPLLFELQGLKTAQYMGFEKQGSFAHSPFALFQDILAGRMKTFQQPLLFNIQMPVCCVCCTTPIYLQCRKHCTGFVREAVLDQLRFAQ